MVCVDGIIVTKNDLEERKTLKLSKRVWNKWAWKTKVILGNWSGSLKKRESFSQQKYVLDLLQEMGKTRCKSIDTLIDPNHKLGEVSENVAIDKGMYLDWLAG